MAFQHIRNIRIAGFAACVPSNVQENAGLDVFADAEEFRRFADTTGVERRHVAPKELCASDLCLAAAEKLMGELGWQKDEIECIVFASNSPDYIAPATSCLLQHRLGLSIECMSFDISFGCSAWVYGLSALASIVSASRFKKALLMTGDTTSRTKSPKDKSTYPLFGDAGTATAIEFADGAEGLKTHMATDGSSYRAIIIEDGGHRNPFSAESLKESEYGEGIVRNHLQTNLDGMSVFSFGITKAPQSIKALLNRSEISIDQLDYLVLHQANLFMNEKIRNKLGVPREKTPNVLKNFGNTSSASIPLTIVSELCGAINSHDKTLQILACGFGVGLSWGSILFSLENAKCCSLFEI